MSQKLQQSSKPFKLCFNNEIHRISKAPTDYRTLVQSVASAFKNNIPASWALQYEDSDGDRVMLTSDEDYGAMIECEADNSAKSIKIYLLSLEGGFNSSELDLSKADSNEYCQILAPQQSEIAMKSESSEFMTQPEEKADEPEIKEEIPEPKEEVQEPVKEEKTEIEESRIEPKILAQNLSNTSAYIDAALDFIDNNKEVKSFEPQEEPEMRRFGRRGCRRSNESRKERIRPAVTDILFENVPVLAELMVEYLKDPSAFNLAELTKKSKAQQESSVSSLNESVVHNRVICDGCGVNPILGVRYKCAVCEDFDYCEKCEATIEHPHPFLKIRNPKQQPKAIITILEEDLPQQEEQRSFSEIGKALSQRISNLSKDTIDHVNRLTEKLVGSPLKKEEEIIKKVEELVVPEKKVEEPVKEVKEPAPVVVEKKVEVPALDVAFVREICTIPAKITVNEKSIYKTIVIKNTGRVEWPNSTKIVNLSGASGQDVKLLPLAPGKDFSCIIVLECPKEADEYISEWQLIYTNEKNQVQNIGESFFVSFAVVQPEIQITNIPFVESQVVQKEVPRPKPVAPKKLYPADVQRKAKTIKDIFADANIDELLEFISQAPRISMEELIENYMLKADSV